MLFNRLYYKPINIICYERLPILDIVFSFMGNVPLMIMEELMVYQT